MFCNSKYLKITGGNHLITTDGNVQKKILENQIEWPSF